MCWYIFVFEFVFINIDWSFYIKIFWLHLNDKLKTYYLMLYMHKWKFTVYFIVFFVMSESTNKYFIFGDWIRSYYEYKIFTKNYKPNIVQNFPKFAVYINVYNTALSQLKQTEIWY